MKKNQRNSNMELMRVLVMLCIVFHHCYTHGLGRQLTDTTSMAAMNNGLFNHPIFYPKLMLCSVLHSLGICSNPLFFMLAGYFLVARGSDVDYGRTFKKVFGQMAFVGLILTLSSDLIVRFDADFDVGVQSVNFPNNHYWFPGCYLTVVLIGVLFLNGCLVKADRARYRNVIFGLIAMASLAWARVLLTGFSTSLGTLTVMTYYYCIGGYIRMYNPFERIRTWVFPAVIAGTEGLIMLSNYNSSMHAIRAFRESGSTGTYIQTIYGISDYSLATLLIAVSVFELFHRLRMPQSRVINSLAKATFMIFLIHETPNFTKIWEKKDWVTPFYYNPWVAVREMALWCLAVYAGCAAVYYVYELLGWIGQKFSPLVLKKAPAAEAASGTKV